MKQNTEVNTFKGEGKTGRFWLGAYHMMEAKISEAIENSRIKRNERGPLASKSKLHAWGCGCCVHLSEYPTEEKFDYARRPWTKASRRRYTFHEVNGRQISRIELPNGSMLEV